MRQFPKSKRTALKKNCQMICIQKYYQDYKKHTESIQEQNEEMFRKEQKPMP